MNEIIIEVEVCKDCERHAWFTSHQSAKYEGYFKLRNVFLSISYLAVESELLLEFPNCKVLKNSIPSHYKKIEGHFTNEDMYYDSKENKIVAKPRIGAFEITVCNKLLFSKLSTGTWPKISLVIPKIKRYIEEEYLIEKYQSPNQSISIENPSIPVQSNVQLPRLPTKSAGNLGRARSVSRGRSQPLSFQSNTIPVKGSSQNPSRPRSNISSKSCLRPTTASRTGFDFPDSNSFPDYKSELKLSTTYFEKRFIDHKSRKQKMIEDHNTIDADISKLNRRTRMLISQIKNTSKTIMVDTPFRKDPSPLRSLRRSYRMLMDNSMIRPTSSNRSMINNYSIAKDLRISEQSTSTEFSPENRRIQLHRPESQPPTIREEKENEILPTSENSYPTRAQNLANKEQNILDKMQEDVSIDVQDNDASIEQQPERLFSKGERLSTNKSEKQSRRYLDTPENLEEAELVDAHGDSLGDSQLFRRIYSTIQNNNNNNAESENKLENVGDSELYHDNIKSLASHINNSQRSKTPAKPKNENKNSFRRKRNSAISRAKETNHHTKGASIVIV